MKTIIAIVLISLTTAALIAQPGGAQTPTYPPLESIKTFKLFLTHGTALDIPADGTSAKELREDPKFLEGLVYTIISPERAMMIGNVGSSEVLLMPRAGGRQFVERTEAGNFMILEIFDQWSSEHSGFFCVYRRSTYYSSGRVGALVSTFWGYAKPWD